MSMVVKGSFRKDTFTQFALEVIVVLNLLAQSGIGLVHSINGDTKIGLGRSRMRSRSTTISKSGVSGMVYAFRVTNSIETKSGALRGCSGPLKPAWLATLAAFWHVSHFL
jgi:hypothetical protein